MSRISEQELTKLYYSIGEVAAMFDVNASLIRFWEKEFQSVKPKKNSKGNRLFTPKDIVKIDEIYHLVKSKGYTLEGAKKALKSNSVTNNSTNHSQSSTPDNAELINRLESVKASLLGLKS